MQQVQEDGAEGKISLTPYYVEQLLAITESTALQGHENIPEMVTMTYSFSRDIFTDVSY